MLYNKKIGAEFFAPIFVCKVFKLLVAFLLAVENLVDACCKCTAYEWTYDENPEVAKCCSALEYCWSY